MEPTSSSPLELCVSEDSEQLVRAHGVLFVVTDRVGDVAPSGA